jgi:serine/threonine-protein kinase
VVNDMPLPPSAAEGALHGDRFDRAVATALAKDPSERYASAAAFRNAVSAALGQPVPPTVSQDAVHALPMPTEYAPTERIAPLHPTGSAPTHWDPAVLAQVEATLARHVGPLAGVLVRRASRLCHDLPALQAALAEQITNVSARDAFLGSRSGTSAGTGSNASGTGGAAGTAGSRTSGTNFQGSGARAPAPAPATFGSMTMGAPVSDALLEQAHRLLAMQLGPIARVVVKRAAERTRQRQPLFALLAEAVPEAARAKLLSELSRLV